MLTCRARAISEKCETVFETIALGEKILALIGVFNNYSSKPYGFIALN